MKKVLMTLAVILTTLMSNLNASSSQNTPQENIKILKDFFGENYNDPNVTAESAKRVIEKYLDPNYIQHVDGKTLHFKDSLPHRLYQLKRIKNIKITFEHLMAEGDRVISIHRAKGDKISGGKIEARVFALFRFRNGKIYLCDELTFTVKGTEKDKDMGSKH